MIGNFWLVRKGNVHVITNTVRDDREDAKRKAHGWIGGDPETYIVEPLTKHGDRGASSDHGDDLTRPLNPGDTPEETR